MTADREPDDTALRRRTRRAIVDAAVHVWARDFAAPQSAVAEQAGVSRSTLHRYFADKAALVDGCLRAADESFGQIEQAATSAPPTEQGALARLTADLEHMLPLSNWVLFVWSDPTRFGDHPLAAQFFGEEGTEPTKDLIRRGQAAGELDPEAPVEWLLDLYYSVLYCAAEGIVRGRLSIAEAARLATRALHRGIAAGDR